MTNLGLNCCEFFLHVIPRDAIRHKNLPYIPEICMVCHYCLLLFLIQILFICDEKDDYEMGDFNTCHFNYYNRLVHVPGCEWNGDR